MTDSIDVLVIDDSLTIRAMMSQVLARDPNITVTVAASAAEADALLAANAFDVVTLDVEMPGVGGMEYLGQLIARHRMPVVMLSASTGAGSRVRTEALLAGALGCFDKADAVRQSKALIQLVRDAAKGRARVGQSDAQAVAAQRAVDGTLPEDG